MLRLPFFIIFALIPALSWGSFETPASHAALMDFTTGTVLYDKKAHEKTKPSSMTKLMTSYIVFDRLHKDVLKLEDTYKISATAAQKGGSKMFVAEGSRVNIHDLLQGVIIQSGNDASIALAEGISGSEESFAKYMNKMAEKIGLNESQFKNATGWPAEGHYMSAYDIAKLSRLIIKDFPEYYHYFSQKEFTYSNITQKNRNLLLFVEGTTVDGLKTGHTDEAGYGIAVSAKQGDKRLIAVVNGLSTEQARASEAERLLRYGFRHFITRTLFKAGSPVGQAKLWFAEEEQVNLITKGDITLIIPKLDEEQITLKIVYDGPIPAPVKAEQKLAKLVITIPNMDTHEIPLYAEKSIDKLSWPSHVIRAFNHYLNQFRGQD